MAPSAFGKFSDEEFAGLNLEGLDENEFQRLARNRMPLILPWHRQPIRIGTGYHSSRQLTADPWATETPFNLAELMLQAKIFRPEQGTTSSFSSKTTSRKAETNDHLTLGFGVGIAPPIPVVAVSVFGQFDQAVISNSDSDKTSTRSTCRLGCVDLEVGPRLTTEAICEIKYRGGYEGFKQRYGDYYVAGYRIGADTGLLLSSSGSSREQVDKYSIKAEVEVLFVTVSKTWNKEFETFRAGRAMKLLGYDTLEDRTWQNSCAAGDSIPETRNWLAGRPMLEEGTLKADAEAVISRSHSLIERVGEVLRRHGVEDGSYLTFKQCEALVADGVVVELLLMPMDHLRDVVRWRLDDNII
ncbi:hypothetical protein M011DRAFT_453964 [Sporormia fimetaria CBS 119925]|uniref:Uncharacterized protein n=1 Tax=Sporormia fimetaria CBS 119925 TaxID=1340428 RepID=A0A6A6UUK7_9PLEO|nr:hypothetical protein M011DRAFT_453964 [Sporormia fimetaria CBS 119925]